MIEVKRRDGGVIVKDGARVYDIEKVGGRYWVRRIMGPGIAAQGVGFRDKQADAIALAKRCLAEPSNPANIDGFFSRFD